MGWQKQVTFSQFALEKLFFRKLHWKSQRLPTRPLAPSSPMAIPVGLATAAPLVEVVTLCDRAAELLPLAHAPIPPSLPRPVCRWGE